MQFEFSDIKNRTQWQNYLGLARHRAQEILQIDPSWNLARAVMKRLDEMEIAVANGRVPTQEEKDYGKMLGVIAVRNFEDSDPKFSDLLEELSYAFEFWEKYPVA